MLIQSHTGIVHIFPAIPESWKDVAFHTLRTEGAFLVSAKMENGNVTEVRIHAEKGGIIKMINPFPDGQFETDNTNVKMEGDLIIVEMEPGEEMLLL